MKEDRVPVISAMDALNVGDDGRRAVYHRLTLPRDDRRQRMPP